MFFEKLMLFTCNIYFAGALPGLTLDVGLRNPLIALELEFFI